ncbi:hypothetical protein FRZ44_30850 [Hypericibacter terrae]|uniref:Uncharacterized protein n=1 Tax=Hypericibacter terrae TaxID=2602015 RepID=A0A5J6MJN6_9PROT|nr:hypothetical protein FRZ44_30850 [Hypericibacter terrae]
MMGEGREGVTDSVSEMHSEIPFLNRDRDTPSLTLPTRGEGIVFRIGFSFLSCEQKEAERGRAPILASSY